MGVPAGRVELDVTRRYAEFLPQVLTERIQVGLVREGLDEPFAPLQGLAGSLGPRLRQPGGQDGVERGLGRVERFGHLPAFGDLQKARGLECGETEGVSNPGEGQLQGLCRGPGGGDGPDRAGGVKSPGEMGGVQGGRHPDEDIVSGHDRDDDIPAAEPMGFGQGEHSGYRPDAGVALRGPVSVIEIRAVAVRRIHHGRQRRRQPGPLEQHPALLLPAHIVHDAPEGIVEDPVDLVPGHGRGQVIQENELG